MAKKLACRFPASNTRTVVARSREGHLPNLPGSCLNPPMSRWFYGFYFFPRHLAEGIG